MSKKPMRIVTIITTILAAVMAIIIILLMSEYIFFQREMERLLVIKEDYNNYTLALKKIIIEYERAHEQITANTEFAEQKKKPITAELSFSLLNREAQHLKQSALVFARQHNIESAVRKLYEHDEIKEESRYYDRKKWRSSSNRHNKRVQRQHFMHKTLKEWQEYSHELHCIWPIERDSFWLSSAFGPRKQPNGSWGFHYGIDMAAVRGTPIKAAAPGIVIEASFVAGYGNTIVLAHGKKFRTRYAHLAKILVTIGDKVRQGELIGKVGDTGNARKRGKDASHLHFEISILGKKVNPLYFLA